MRAIGRHSDRSLVSRLAAGDERAWDELDRRYRKALGKYVGSLMRPGVADPDDIVQDALVKAYRHLRGGAPPTAFKPWVYRLCRNTAIDAIRAAQRRPADRLDDVDVLDHAAGPDMLIFGKERMRQIAEDVSALPDQQRAALLARGVDGVDAGEVAAELGVSEGAVHMLVVRARENLIASERARDADCERIRALLEQAASRKARAKEEARRHLKHCDGCREYSVAVRRLDRRLNALAPPALPIIGALLAKAGGVGAKPVAAGLVALTVTATGGVVVLASDEHRAGAPAPFAIKGIRGLTGKTVRGGEKIPARTAVITARVSVPAGAPADGQRRTVTLPCPAGMRVAGMQAPEQHFPMSYGLRSDTVIGSSTRAVIHFERAVMPKAMTATVGVLCRRPDASGSLQSQPRLTQPGERAAKICVRQTYLYREPGRLFTGTVYRGQPVSVLRSTGKGEWARVITDSRLRGWVRASELC